MEIIQELIANVFAATEDAEGEAERCGSKIAKSISNEGSAGDPKIRLPDVIQLLENKLTSQEVQHRALAMDIMYNIFNSLKSNYLTEQELTFIVDFLHDRLKDQHLIIPKVILCLSPIVRCTNLPEGSCSKLLNQVFIEVNVQSHIHRHRRSLFLTLQHMLKHHLPELKANCSTDFVMHFLQSMDGEKDPRNLLVLFSCIPTILTHFPIGPFAEDFFEVLACYFPVDFNPVMRASTLELIKREDLVETLHSCLSHTNLFAKFLVPLIMEKLNSALIDAKLDALNLFSMCCEKSYTPEDVSPFLTAIWHSLRREIFLGGNEVVETASIAFIGSAFKLLSRDQLILKTSVELVFSECKHHLSEPELRLSQPTSKILLTIAESSEASCMEVFGMTMSVLYKQFLENTLSSNRKGILGIMKKLISTLSAFPSLSLGNMLICWDEMMCDWFTLLSHSDPEFVILALGLFGQLFENKLCHTDVGESSTFDLDDKYRNILQEHLYSLLMKPDGPTEVEAATIYVMQRFAHCFGDEFVNLLIPKLLNIFEVPEDNSPQIYDVERLNTIVKAVSECSLVPIVGKITIPVLLRVSSEQTSTGEDRLNQIIHCLTETVDKICQNKLEKYEDDRKDLINFVCLELDGLNTLVKAAISCFKSENHELFKEFTKIVGNLMRTAEESTQQYLINKLWNEKVDVSVSTCLDNLPISLAEAILASIYPSVNVTNKKKLINILLERISCPPGTTTEANLNVDDQLDNEGGADENESDKIGTIRLLCVLLNKLGENDFTELLAKIERILDETLPLEKLQNDQMDTTEEPSVDEPNLNPSTGVDARETESTEPVVETETNSENSTVADSNRIKLNPKTESAVILLIWTTKSVAMRGFSELDKWVNKLITLLDTEEFGTMAAHGFSTILLDSKSSLSPDNHCIFRFLFKQRIFIISVPKLIRSYRHCSTKSEKFKVNYIKALSCQLKHIPKSLLHTQLVNVIPLLVAGLNINTTSLSQSTDELILLSSLKALFELFDSQQSSTSTDATSEGDGDGKSSLIQYFHDLAPRLLELSRFTANMEVRIVSLKCLQRCAKFPTHIILPLKDKVVLELKNCLDDSKRLVRREAVLTRNLWILAGAPGGL